MSWTNRVVWQEGMFLRTQHFQQQDRWLEQLVRGRVQALRPHPWGLVDYALDRDLLGTGVDVAFDPLTYAQFHGRDTWMVVRFGMGVLDSRASQLDAVETIERSSIDFYATTRNLYRQSRNAKINEGKTTGTDDLPNL